MYKETNKIKEGKIVVNEKYYKNVNYHVSNNCISIVFDGKGGLGSYSEANKKDYFTNGWVSIYENNKHISPHSDKEVSMIGRMQETSIELSSGLLRITQFIDADTNGVYSKYELVGSKDTGVDIAIMFSRVQDIKLISTDNIRKIKDNSSINIELNSNNNIATMFISFAEDYNEDSESYRIIKDNIIDYYNKAYNKVIEEIESIEIPTGLNKLETQTYYNNYFCSLMNYKEFKSDNLDYKAFSAGHKYSTPLRSYYRDSYYTVLPLYEEHPDKVKNQVITLAKGITQEFKCPSAVKADMSPWWIGHYDSPSFYVMMLYDYINYTNDTNLLDYIVNHFGVKRTLLELASLVVQAMSAQEKEGLLYKIGEYNKCDWADEVNRSGYVTYNNILYARANYCLSKLYEIYGSYKGEDYNEISNQYYIKYNSIINKMNNILWSDKLGYYVNFITYENDENKKVVEDNLSIDIVLAIVFGMTTTEQTKSILENMEKKLEVKNNSEVAYLEGFGVMCVYPLYSGVKTAYNKSSQPFNYHNGANWPYLTAMYALAKRENNMEYKGILTDCFSYNIEKGNYTPVEYFSPVCPDGSLLQAWNGAIAFVLNEKLSKNFYK